jgi:hypothetical protein
MARGTALVEVVYLRQQYGPGASPLYRAHPEDGKVKSGERRDRVRAGAEGGGRSVSPPSRTPTAIAVVHFFQAA